MTLLPLLFFILPLMSAPPPAALPSDVTNPADSTLVFYGEQDVHALQRLLKSSDDRALDLLCRYRLYPLTEDRAYLEDLPADLDDATARELALLSGLWGYRVLETSIFSAPKYGLRASRLLEAAKALDPEDPFVLLIDGQSLLFRPALFGGDPRAALDRFYQLREVLAQRPGAGISRLEAELWIWYALEKLDARQASALRNELLAQNPPPLFRSFLMDPP